MCQIPSTSLNQTPVSTLPIPRPDNQIRKSGLRLKFWELNSRYHCAALGTCLTLKELRQLGKKAGIEGIEAWDDYDTHISFLNVLDVKCYVSTLVNKFLNKKYKINILYFSKTKSEEDRVNLWNNAVGTGEIAGAFWAMLTHPDSTDAALFQVYGKVHMLSHLSGATARIDLREFHKLEERNSSLQSQLNLNEAVFNKKLDKKETQLTRLKTELLRLRQVNEELVHAKDELKEIKNSPLVLRFQKEVVRLKANLEHSKLNLERFEKNTQKWEFQAKQEQQKSQRLEQQFSSLVDEKASIESTLTNLLSQEDSNIDNCKSCPNANTDLCGRCVLYIGGRNSQYTHFRKLVEQQNGAFIHHDGGREDGHQKLASIVSKADVVVCPLDCVSHTAMNAVKRHCQNNTKQLVFIPHASLSAFSKGLTEAMN